MRARLQRTHVGGVGERHVVDRDLVAARVLLLVYVERPEERGAVDEERSWRGPS